MSNPNSLGNSEPQASSSDDTGWDSLSQVTFRGGMRTGEYLNSNEGDQELSIEETFDKWSAEIDDMVSEGRMTEEEGYKMKETMLDSAVEGIDTVRQDYLNRINGRNPQEPEPEPTADDLAYQKWLAEHPGKSEGYESAHGNTSGPSFSDMDFSRPRDVRDKVIKDADGNVVGVDREDSKPRTYSEWDVYNRQKGETSREFGDRAKSRHEAEGRYEEREKLIQDVMRKHDDGKIDRAFRDKRIRTIMNASPKPRETVYKPSEEEKPVEALNEDSASEITQEDGSNETSVYEVAPAQITDITSTETSDVALPELNTAQPPAKKGLFGKIRSLFSRNKQKKNKQKDPSQITEEQLAKLKELERRRQQSEEEFNAQMRELDERTMARRRKMDELFERANKPFEQAVKEAEERDRLRTGNTNSDTGTNNGDIPGAA